MTRTPLRSLALLLLLSLSSPAALPLKAIKGYQAKAPIIVDLEVSKVRKVAVVAGRLHSFHIEVTAKVLAVHRSGDTIAKGDEITITYTRPNQKKSPAAGDWPGELKKTARYKAYLKVENAGKKQYRPGAYSGSFEAAKPAAG